MKLLLILDIDINSFISAHFCQQITLYIASDINMKVVSFKLQFHFKGPILNNIENMIRTHYVISLNSYCKLKQ